MSEIKTVCSATLDEKFVLNISYLSHTGTAGTMSLWANLVYTYNATYPTWTIFKLTTFGVINNPSSSCTPSTLGSDLSLHIPDMLLSDGVTHVSADLRYSPDLSTSGNIYFVVKNYSILSQ